MDAIIENVENAFLWVAVLVVISAVLAACAALLVLAAHALVWLWVVT